jgi:hypothetical protein
MRENENLSLNNNYFSQTQTPTIKNNNDSDLKGMKLNFEYNSPSLGLNEVKRYDTTNTEGNMQMMSNETNPIHSSNDILSLQSKLETKKLRLKEVQKQFDQSLEENAHLKLRIQELERYKSSVNDKFNTYDQSNMKNEMQSIEKERELLGMISQLEHEKAKAEERLNKFQQIDKLKTQEIELMNQKIRDFELILDENTNEHIESIRGLKNELDMLKLKDLENEKFFEILNYFFKKMSTLYNKFSSTQNTTNDERNSKEPKILQNKLLELENFIIKLLNERTNLNQKYSKIVDIHNKLTHNSEMLDTSEIHLDNLRKLNEKIYDLEEENKFLKNELNNNGKENNSHSNNNGSNNSQIKFDKTDKENIFQNNYIKEHLNKGQNQQNTGSVINTENSKNHRNNTPNFLADNYKTLEHRVLELEKELKQSI